MELIGKLKQKEENAAGKEEARELIEQTGVKLTDEEAEQVSGGQNVFNYYGKQLFCSCGCGDFTCLGWKEKPSGNYTAGYEFCCNYCGKTFINYVR